MGLIALYTRQFMQTLLVAALVMLLGCGSTEGLNSEQPRDVWSEMPEPDQANVPYGDHERNVMDLWLAKADSPTPLVIYIHGGGFYSGDKRSIRPELLQNLLDAGISVAAINYRLSDTHSFPAAHRDAARAVQFLRYNAMKWNIDKVRIGATGASAGGGISLWLAFHDNLSDPDNQDPIFHESTRLAAIAVTNAQPSYDPRFARSIGLPKLEEHPFFLPFYGITKEEIATPYAYSLYEEAAAINLLSEDDNTPILMVYNRNFDVPIDDDTSMNVIVHHINFGHALKEQMDPLGLECTVVHREGPGFPQVFEFLHKHLQ